MALLIGNKTQANPIPASNSYTIAHNQNTGSDGFLMVAVCMANTVSHTGATYDGTPMTEFLNYTSSTLSQTWVVYGLQSPSTGSNNIVLSFSSNQFNSISVFAVSFTGSSGIGSVGNNDVAPEPHPRTISVFQNSIVYAFGVSNSGISGFEIDGSNRPSEFTHNTNRQVEGAFSLTGLNAGSISVIIDTDFASVSNTRIEIKEAVLGKKEGSFFLVL